MLVDQHVSFVALLKLVSVTFSVLETHFLSLVGRLRADSDQEGYLLDSQTQWMSRMVVEMLGFKLGDRSSVTLHTDFLRTELSSTVGLVGL